MLMERSRNSTISIHIAFESCVNTDQLREVVRGIAESATRWRTLALRGESAEGLVAVIQQCRGTSPSIEDVSIHGGLEWGAEVDLGGFFDGGEWEHALPDDAPKVVGLPRLRHLELHDFKRVERMPYAPNLLKLELCRVHVSLGQLLKTLGECTGLEKLYLIDATWTARQLQLDALYGASDNVPEDPASLPSPVLLRHLTRLAIVDSSLPCTSRLLESISFPTLRHLRFSFECSLGSMRECFDTLMKDNPPLISAHLSVFTSTAIEEEIVRLLWKMKSLERLYLWHGCGPSGRPSKHAESPMIHALTRHAKVDHVEGPDTGRLFLPRLTTLWSTTVLDPRALQYVVQTRTSAVFSVEGVQRLSEVGVNWPLFHFGTAVAKDIKRYVSLVDSREVGPFDSGEDCAGRSFYMES
ncbi:hypothetical protein FRB99_006601 [Tulasnella sp. 403]|nr:hypothetical protein FRB99_006601 [Tulasnella sp. 403]